jgi:hypothetical protein
MSTPFTIPSLLLVLATTSAPSAGRWSGEYCRGFERNDFQADGQNEKWWVVDKTGKLQTLLPKPLGVPQGTIRVAVSGELSPVGRYGHLGLYRHQLVVTQVHESKK